MARRLLIALVVLAALAGGALFLLRSQLRAASPAPPELARVADPTSQRRLPQGGDVVGFAGRYGSHVWLGFRTRSRRSASCAGARPRRPRPGAERARRSRSARPARSIASPFGGADGAERRPSAAARIASTSTSTRRASTRPRAAGEATLPVMVWIHGGGNTIGQRGFYDGGHLAAGPERRRRDHQLPARSARLVPPRGAARRAPSPPSSRATSARSI